MKILLILAILIWPSVAYCENDAYLLCTRNPYKLDKLEARMVKKIVRVRSKTGTPVDLKKARLDARSIVYDNFHCSFQNRQPTPPPTK